MAGIFTAMADASGDDSAASSDPAANCRAAAAGVAAAGEAQAPLKGTAHGESTATTGCAAGAAGAKAPLTNPLFNAPPPLSVPPIAEPPRKRPVVRGADGGRLFCQPADKQRPLPAAAAVGGCSGNCSSSPMAQAEDAALKLSKLVPRDSLLLETPRESPNDDIEAEESRRGWSENPDEQRSTTIEFNSFQLCGGPARPAAKLLRDRLLGLCSHVCTANCGAS